MDEIRRQLAELMETVESSTSSSKKRSFTDLDVCKYYLTGLCPHDLFQNTVSLGTLISKCTVAIDW